MKQQGQYFQANGKSMQGGLLIEVMVCALLLAIGVLAVIASQSTGMKSARDAYLYLQADALVSDMVDRILANPTVATAYEGSTGQYQSANSPGCASSQTGCSPQDRAEADKVDWAALFSAASRGGQSQELLPRGEGEIEVNGNEVKVWVQWEQEGTGNGLHSVDTDCGRAPANFIRVCATFQI